ncbi:putative ABC transport system permease protein [Kineothrix alysoides]|uniref:Putative ABC transport system permease protein n=1 Tax=Kineothrix alysoides TaxID=1469948 RepID=A0A4R1QYG7_9FIRM|nr:ABC transporter permease [Kineothrix alysoides]TCL57530.1 putative ABC transport system permease protein [Kineothrix alysoides]
MLTRMLKKDFQRNKIIAVTLFLFIMLAALSISCAVGVITEISGATTNLFEKASIPHFTQMHAGEINNPDIDSFAAEHGDIIESHQTAEMLNIDGADIFLGNNESSEADNIQQNAFVKQNTVFGFFLDMDNQVLRLNDGEIAVPIYHKQEYNLQIGDTVRIQSGNYSKEFTIVSYLRDAQMNSALSESKRFLVSDNDFADLRENIGEIEYLIEFRLHDVNNIGELESLYLSAGLPQKGPSVTYPLYRLLNSASDDIVAAVMILVGVLLGLIAALCLRFTMIAAMEEDYREIGVMRAIGINHKDIGKLYLTKYVVMAAAASIVGYALSFIMGSIFTANIRLYMGEVEKTVFSRLLPMAGAVLIFLAVVLFCRLVLRRFRHISAVEAIRNGSSSDNGGIGRQNLMLHKSAIANVNVFLGVKEVIGHFRVYGLLCVVFMVCTFLIILPINTLNTIESPEYITYMGVGRSDMRIDIQRGDMNRQYNDLLAYLQNDREIDKYAGFFAGSYEALTPDGMYERIRIESGDFSVFPLEYMQGSAPGEEGEIALSVMNADAFGKKIGEPLTVLVNGQEQNLTVCGIYQDTTNAGKTAKAILPHDPKNILWYVVYMNIKDGAGISAKGAEYASAFSDAKVNEVDEVVRQTMGNVIGQLKSASIFAVGIAVGIAVLITAMFFKMLTAKEAPQIAILRSVGFSMKDIQVQYVTRVMIVLLIGIVIGMLAAGTLGQSMAALMIPGASSIKFVVGPLTYLLCPASIISAVIITLWLVIAPMKKTSGFIMSVE